MRLIQTQSRPIAYNTLNRRPTMGFDLAFRCRDVNGNLTFPSQETIITLVEWITGQPANYTDWKPRWDAYQAMLNIPAAEQDETAIHNAWDLAHTDFTDYLLSDL